MSNYTREASCVAGELRPGGGRGVLREAREARDSPARGALRSAVGTEVGLLSSLVGAQVGAAVGARHARGDLGAPITAMLRSSARGTARFFAGLAGAAALVFDEEIEWTIVEV